jgi:phage-related protein
MWASRRFDAVQKRGVHQFVKETDKTPPRELAVARKRMKEWKDVDA